ncbi:MAG: glycoside hydrolase, family 43 [Acidimicrobiales bacterium]|nr:glycoside hydrolase, family 43 [Acidimicrobiales bacterium]
MTAVLPIAPSAAAPTTPAWSVLRIGGSDRYSTAAALSRHTFRNRTPQVVVASGEQFADALAATPAAARLGAPLLLTRRSEVPTSTYNELKRLRPSVILLAGGTNVVSSAVERRLATVARVLRLAGTDRFDTAARLSAAAFGTGVPVAFLAQGHSFSDALAAGAAAGRLEGPVLLVERNRVPAVVAKELARLRPARIVLVGGESAIGQPVADSVRHGDVDRVGGRDRYATATALASLVPGGAGVALIASGSTFPDALAAGPSASALGGTFALTGANCLPTAAAQGMADNGVRQVLVIGGENAVSDDAAEPCEPVNPTRTPSPVTVPPVPAPAPDGLISPTLTPFSSLPEDVADPTVLKVGDRWYAYSTQVYLTQVPMRWSTDLRSWSRAAEAMPSLASWAEFGAHWAPSAVAAGGRYVLWYSARDHASGGQCISRAVADRPEGPFHDELNAAPVCQAALGGSIDPHVFTDDDGRRWLSWKSDENAVGKQSRLWVAPLSADGRTLTGQASVLLSQGAPWETFTIEQPAIVRHGDLYYLFYSGGFWESSSYAIGYATALSPRGPFTRRTAVRPWFAGVSRAAGPGALDVFVGPDGQPWATYHAWADTIGYANFGMRTLRVGRLTF